MYFNHELNNSIRSISPQIYPNRETDNLGICLTNPGSSSPFMVLMTDAVTEYNLPGAGNKGMYLSRWRYVPGRNAGAESPTKGQLGLDKDSPELRRVSNINSDALARIPGAQYGDQAITEDDLFYYTYGVLHSPQWRETFANDLAKERARHPDGGLRGRLPGLRGGRPPAGRLARQLRDGRAVAVAGAMGAWLGRGGARRVSRRENEPMLGGGPNPDKSRIVYNAGIMLAGIPAVAHEYQLGSRSALDWLIDRYQLRNAQSQRHRQRSERLVRGARQPTLRPRPVEARHDRQRPHSGDRALVADGMPTV